MQTPTLERQLWLRLGSWSPLESKGNEEKTGQEKYVQLQLSLPIRICDLFVSFKKKFYLNSI